MLNILKVLLLVLPRAPRKEELVDVLEKLARAPPWSQLAGFLYERVKKLFMKLMHDSTSRIVYSWDLE